VLEHKNAFPDELSPSIFPVKAIQVQKFVWPFGLAIRLSNQAFDEKRENW